MDLAYAAADLVVARSGAMTVAELSAVGLPAVYVPLPHGNGEQRLNAAQVLASGAAIAVDNADFHADAVRRTVIDLMTDDQRFSAMRAAAAVTVTTRADRVVAQMVLSAGKGT
jgi:UDP-N-acetylglucosamine--N-acetylmuramyl-(pentapeptide) pyrophosphoryl-undecaprenol N-acetylglucosamine transferase